MPMTATPSFMTDRPAGLAPPGPEGSDVLSEALRLFRLGGAMLLRGDFTAPWAFAAPESCAIAKLLRVHPRRLVILHIVAEGTCWVRVQGQPPATLDTGDIVLFPHGHGHVMGSGNALPVPVGSLFPPPPWRELPLLEHGGGGPPTRIVCAYLMCDHLLFNPFLDSLPAMLSIKAEGAGLEWFRASVRYLIDEACSALPGSACLTARMTELLFIEALRRHIVMAEGSDNGWFAALADRHLGRVLHAVHADPEHDWSLDELAGVAGLSRSVLTQRFRRMLGCSPIHYLHAWRLQRAAQAMLKSDQSIANIALAAGYHSEEAFSRAFKRCSGLPPATWRRSRVLGEAASANGCSADAPAPRVAAAAGPAVAVRRR